MTIGDVITALSDKGRTISEETIKGIGINPNSPVLLSGKNSDNSFQTKSILESGVEEKTDGVYQRTEEEDAIKAAILSV